MKRVFYYCCRCDTLLQQSYVSAVTPIVEPFFIKNFVRSKNFYNTICKMKYFIYSVVIFVSTLSLFAQEKQYQISCVAFYNLENLFDTIDTPEVNDIDFTPKGSYAWTSTKYHNKLENMSSAISQIGGKYAPDGPAVIGVSEVENRQVLEDLVKMPALKKANYGIVHYDSPDRRGIDVALLYNKEHFTPIKSDPYRLHIDNDSSFRTRDQLLVEGMLDGDTIYVIVNHWPSRSGGEFRSRPKRVAAAALTKHIADSVMSVNKSAKIIIMGDLNDDPTNESCKETLNAQKNKEQVVQGGLYNASWSLFAKGIGSLAYRDSWNLFDQIIISYGLLNAETTIGYKFWKSYVFNEDFLTQQEGRYKGYPKRTHAGGSYLNGYSDHFPSYIYLVKEL